MLSSLVSLSNIGAFFLALFIAIIGYKQTRKMNDDRVNELILKFNESKLALELAYAKYLRHETEEVFNEFHIFHSNHVNAIELFSKMILNQKLYKTKSFQQFQGSEMKCLSEAIDTASFYTAVIFEHGFDKFGDVSTDITRRMNLKKSLFLLKKSTTLREYNDLIDELNKYEFY